MKKPNIIWIYCDELRTGALGCYGNRHTPVNTPNIDRLAAEGVLFENCFCNSPVCVPSRLCALSGLYPEDTGVYHNEAHWPNFRLGAIPKTFPEVFAENGYRTADFGKLHIPRQLRPWQHWNSEGSGMDFAKEISPEDLEVIEPPGVPTKIGGRFPAGRPYPPEKLTRNALQWLASAQEPYLVRLSYLQPHTPVYPPPPYDSFYQGRPFPPLAREINPSSQFEKRFAEITRASEMTDEQIHLAQVYYYGLVAWIDGQVGKLLDFLRQTGRLGSTVLVFTADHGASLGENGCYAKHIFASQVHRVPLLFRHPDSLPSGQARGGICESLDLPRTLFALAGLEAPASFKGRDMFSSSAPRAVYSTIGYGFPGSRAFPNLGRGEYTGGRGWPRRACVRTRRHRLDKNVRIDGRKASPEEEDIFFTDWLEHPEENRNLAAAPGCRDAVAALSKMLDKHTSNSIEPPPEHVRR